MTSAPNLSAASRPGSLKEAAAENKVSTWTIRRRIATGELRAWKLGYRILRIDLDEAAALFKPVPTVSGELDGAA
jgi:excisionase family DNA binding protein